MSNDNDFMKNDSFNGEYREPENDDFFADDDLDEVEIGDETASTNEQNEIIAKMNDIRNAVSKRRQSGNKKSSPAENYSETTAKTGHRKSAAVVGVLFSVLALVGLGTVLYFAITGVRLIINDESRLKRYDSVLAPVVFFDPEPFETWQDPKMEDDLLTISVWTTMEENPDTFQINEENGRTVIPTEYVTATAQKLFGPDVRLNFNVFENEGAGDANGTDAESSPCIWDPDAGTIEVLMASFEGYTHRVTKVSRKGDTMVCTVAYLASYNSENGQYSKLMSYILKKNPESGEYYISAVRNTESEA